MPNEVTTLGQTPKMKTNATQVNAQEQMCLLRASVEINQRTRREFYANN